MSQLDAAGDSAFVNHPGQFRQPRQVDLPAVADPAPSGHPPGKIDKAMLDDDQTHAALGHRFIKAEIEVADLSVVFRQAQRGRKLHHSIPQCDFIDAEGRQKFIEVVLIGHNDIFFRLKV
jgi:hypothetical protein